MTCLDSTQQFRSRQRLSARDPLLRWTRRQQWRQRRRTWHPWPPSCPPKQWHSRPTTLQHLPGHRHRPCRGNSSSRSSRRQQRHSLRQRRSSATSGTRQPTTTHTIISTTTLARCRGTNARQQLVATASARPAGSASAAAAVGDRGGPAPVTCWQGCPWPRCFSGRQTSSRRRSSCVGSKTPCTTAAAVAAE